MSAMWEQVNSGHCLPCGVVTLSWPTRGNYHVGPVQGSSPLQVANKMDLALCLFLARCTPYSSISFLVVLLFSPVA